MERHEILETMDELKLCGMRASFDEIAGKGLSRRDEFYPLVASLIRAERMVLHGDHQHPGIAVKRYWGFRMNAGCDMLADAGLPPRRKR